MHKNRIIIAIVLTIISFFIFWHCLLAIAAIETFSSCMLYPLLRIQQIVIEPIRIWIGRSRTIGELEQALQEIQKKHDELFAENVVLKATHHYAYETNELRNFNKKYLLGNGKLAQVLARHFSPKSQFFFVDAGAQQGIKKDMVALYNNIIVGRVAEVYPWYCKVCLITDLDCKVAAICLSSAKGACGIHEGTNDVMHTIMRYVSHLDVVNVGDDLFSSGEGLVFPKGFALGKVISAEKGELFYTILVKPALDLQTLRYCTLIAKEDIG